ncbi:XAC0095 family protein [Pseudoxanthomonas sp. 22568]|uniref:XAC0095 family protein n=1 Tax=Pseudoxanthomonas sp. 22568 TaxID=3453945 RepID=UPI003F851489
MSGKSDTSMGYWVSEEHQLRLVQLRDQLRLMSDLSSPRNPQDEHMRLPIKLQAMADCFAGMSDDLGRVLRRMQWMSLRDK